MKRFLSHPLMTKIAIIIGGILLVGGIGYGVYRIYRMKLELRVAHTQIQDLTAILQVASQQLNQGHILSEEEKATLAAALQASKQDIETLQENTRSLSDTVATYQKLDTLDPELLKKYSKVFFLNENYVPSSITSITSEYVKNSKRTLQIHTDVWPHLDELLTAAKNANLSLLVTSAYRSFGAQAALKEGYKIRYGTTSANSFSADQGYSEHQLGTTVDFITAKASTLSQSFDKTPEYKWLVDNAYKYGFVLSYPKGNAYYIYEPWHWRYVGIALATKLHDQKLNLYDVDQRMLDSYLIKIFD